MRNLYAHILGAVLLVSLPIAGSAQEVKIGSVIHLQNRFSEGGRVNYLDARARVMDQPAFKGVSENVFVFTDASKDRDKGSGSWKVVSASGKKDGETLVFGDKIHLQNMYSGAGFLDEWGDKLVNVYQPVLRNADDTDFPVFTSKSANRDNGSGTWTVTVYQGKDKVGQPVDADDIIKLESGIHPGHFLRTYVPARELSFFKDWSGTEKLVFTSDTNFRGGQEAWTVSLKSEASAQGGSSQEPLCSKNLSATPLDVKWENKTGADITVHWVSQECQAQKGQLVKAGAAFTGRSYPGHVFVVFLAETGTELKPITVGPSTAAAPITR